MDDFAETMPMPPDVPCPTVPFHQFAYSDVPVPAPQFSSKIAAIPFPDPELVEAAWAKHQRRQRQLEQIEDARQAQWSELVLKAEERGYANGKDHGEQHGRFHGWWHGLAFGVMLGVAACYFAVKLGWLVGKA